MEPIVLSAHEVVPTFRSEREEEWHPTWTWLGETVAAKGVDTIPPIVVIRDPENGQLLVYDGNKRVGYFRNHSHMLRAIVLSTEEEFKDHLYATNMVSFGRARQWFGHMEFSLFLPLMRTYAEWIRTGVAPEGFFDRYHEMQEANHWYVREHELFGYDDDE